MDRTEHKHTLSRDFALKFLYQSEMQRQFFFEEGRFQEFCSQFAVPPKAVAYCRKIVSNVFDWVRTIDTHIESASKNWKVARMPTMDRIILRIAIAEVLDKTTPPKVILDEAIDLAKKYGSEASSKYVNGVLDAVIHGKIV